MDLDNTLHKLVCSQILFRELIKYKLYKGRNFVELDYVTQKVRDSPLIKDTLRKFYNDPLESKRKSNKEPNIDNEYVLNNLIAGVLLIYYKQLSHQDPNATNKTLVTVINQKSPLTSPNGGNASINTIIKFTAPIEQKLTFFKNLIYQLNNIVKKLLLYDIKSLEVKFKNYTNDIEIIESGRYTEEMLLKDDQEFKMSRRNKNQSTILQKQREKEKQQPKEKLQEKPHQKNKLQFKPNAEKPETPILVDNIAIKNSLPSESSLKLNKESSPSDIRMINHPPVVTIDQAPSTSVLSSSSISKNEAECKESKPEDLPVKEIVSKDEKNIEKTETETHMNTEKNIPIESNNKQDNHYILAEKNSTAKPQNQESIDTLKPSKEITNQELENETLKTPVVENELIKDALISIGESTTGKFEKAAKRANEVLLDITCKVSRDSQKLASKVPTNEQQKESTKNKSTKIPLIAYASAGKPESKLPDVLDLSQTDIEIDNNNASKKIISDLSNAVSENLSSNNLTEGGSTEDNLNTVDQDNVSSSNKDELNIIEMQKDTVINELSEQSKLDSSVNEKMNGDAVSNEVVKINDNNESQESKDNLDVEILNDNLDVEILNEDSSVGNKINLVTEATALSPHSEQESRIIQKEKRDGTGNSEVSQSNIDTVGTELFERTNPVMNSKDEITKDGVNDFLYKHSVHTKIEEKLKDEESQCLYLETADTADGDEDALSNSEVNVSSSINDKSEISKESNGMVRESLKDNMEAGNEENNKMANDDKVKAIEQIFIPDSTMKPNMLEEKLITENSIAVEIEAPSKSSLQDTRVGVPANTEAFGEDFLKKALSGNIEDTPLIELKEAETDEDEGHSKDADVFKDAKENFEEKDEALLADELPDASIDEGRKPDVEISDISAKNLSENRTSETSEHKGAVVEQVDMHKEAVTSGISAANPHSPTNRQNKNIEKQDLMKEQNEVIGNESKFEEGNEIDEEKTKEGLENVLDIVSSEEKQEKKRAIEPLKRDSNIKESSVSSSRKGSKNSSPKNENSPHRNLRSSNELFEPIELQSELYTGKRQKRLLVGKSELFQKDEAQKMQSSPSGLPAKRVSNPLIESKLKAKKIRYSTKLDDLQKQKDNYIDSEEENANKSVVEAIKLIAPEETKYKSEIKHEKDQEEQAQGEEKKEEEDSIGKRINRRKSSRLEYHKDLVSEKLKGSDSNLEDSNMSSNLTNSANNDDVNLKTKKRKLFEKKHREERSAIPEDKVTAAPNKKLVVREGRNNDSTKTYVEDENEETSQKKRRSLEVSINKKFIALANQIIDSISSLKFSSPFLNPVNENDAPSYYSVIYQPRDLKSIKNMVKIGEIANIKQLEREIMLMYANSVMYNRSNTDMNKWALEMEEESNKIMKMFSSSDFNDL